MTREPSEGDVFGSAVAHRKRLMGSAGPQYWSCRLQRFMERQAGVRGEVAITNVHLPAAGGSSGTLMFTVEIDDGSGRSSRDFVLRHATDGGLFHSYDLPAQFGILHALQNTLVPVPRVVGIDAAGEVLGVTGFVMERVAGQAPPPRYLASGVLFEASAQDRRKMVDDVIATLAKLHAVDWRTRGIGPLLSKRGSGLTPVERDVDWYWRSLCWGCPEEVQDLEPVRNWLLERQPLHQDECLNHGDTILGNYMFRDNRVVAALDWELAFIGSPENDVAYQAFAHSVLSLGCEPLPGFPSEEEWRSEYQRASGHELADWDYYFAFAVFKIHISMLLVFRNAPSPLASARHGVLQFTRESLRESQGKVCR